MVGGQSRRMCCPHCDAFNMVQLLSRRTNCSECGEVFFTGWNSGGLEGLVEDQVDHPCEC